MRKSLFLLLFMAVSCAQLPDTAPSWVSGVRSGEESLKVTNGSKIFYRRIAGGAELRQEISCELVMKKVQEDIRKDQLQGPQTVEALYYDPYHRDCAVTVSVRDIGREVASLPPTDPKEKFSFLHKKGNLNETEIAEYLKIKTELATTYAMTGLSLQEFEKFSGLEVNLVSSEGSCTVTFESEQGSLHGNVNICWKQNHIQGYCLLDSGQCWKKEVQ